MGIAGCILLLQDNKHQETVLITTPNRGYDTWNLCNMYPRFCTTHVIHPSPRGVLTFHPHYYLQGSLRIRTSADHISSSEGRFLCRIISSRTCNNHFRPAPFSLWGLFGLYYILRWQRGTDNRKHRERESQSSTCRVGHLGFGWFWEYFDRKWYLVYVDAFWIVDVWIAIRALLNCVSVSHGSVTLLLLFQVRVK